MKSSFRVAVAIGAASAAAASLKTTEGNAALNLAEHVFLEKRSQHRHGHVHHRQPKTSAEAFREVDKSLATIMQDGDANQVNQYVEKLGGVEAALGSFANEDLYARVGKMRMELCAEVGCQKHEVDQCESFMGVACSLEGAGSGEQVSADKCEKFFMQKRDRVANSGESSEKTEETAAAAVAQDSTSDEEDKEEAVEEPAANATNATNGSGGDAFFGGKKYRELPEQGYNEYEDGKLVEHRNVVSHTGDWLSERDGRSKEEICKEFPNNQWCQMHMPQPKKRREVPPPVPEPPAPPAPPPPAPEATEAPEEKSDASRGFAHQIFLASAAVLVAACRAA